MFNKVYKGLMYGLILGTIAVMITVIPVGILFQDGSILMAGAVIEILNIFIGIILFTIVFSIEEISYKRITKRSKRR